MAEFKTGDRVVFTKDDDWLERGALVRMPKGTLGTYDDAPGNAAPWVRLDTGERVRAWSDVLAPAEDHGTGDGSASDICAEPGCNCDLERRFPAPLDPAKVKAGDTVTLEKGTAKHVDLVADVDRYQDGDYRFKSTTSPTHVYRVGDGAWTLTDHQPAPEPEPYTPTREQIRQAYVDARGDADLITESEAGAEFDRWLDSLGLTR
jgi:hypothetical protein